MEPSKYITLISGDGYEFVVLRKAAMLSPMIKSMLDPNSAFMEAKDSRCTFDDINGVVLEKVAEYFHYVMKHAGKEDVPDMDIPVEICLELVMAADYLQLDKTL